MQDPRSQFEWHDQKNSANLRKHGIRFEDAAEVFATHVLLFRSGTEEENRWKALALLDGKVIAVIFTERAGRRRLISARPASRSERRTHNEGKGEIHMGIREPEPLWDESKQVPDEEIDFSEIPETEPWEWKYARPINHPEAFSKELSDAYYAERRERDRQKQGLRDESKKP